MSVIGTTVIHTTVAELVGTPSSPAGHLHRASESAQTAAGTWLLPLALWAVLVGVYFALVLRRGLVLQRRWSHWRGLSWTAGSAAIAWAVSPALQMDHSAIEADAGGAQSHMIQHLLLGMYGPVLLVLAAPITVLLGASGPSGRRLMKRVLSSSVLHVLGHPLAAAGLHTAPLFLLYLTPLYEQLMHNPVLHAAVNVHFVLAGALYAWSIAGPDPAPRRPGVLLRASVLVISAGLHAWLATLIYSRAYDLPAGTLHGPQDLQYAAQLMYYGGDIAELALAAALFAGWYRLRTRQHDNSLQRTSEPRVRSA